MQDGTKTGRPRSSANAPLSDEKQKEYINSITNGTIKEQLKEVQKLHKQGAQFTVKGPNGTTKQQGVLEYWVRQDMNNLAHVVNNDVKVTQGKGKNATKELAITHLLRTGVTVRGNMREENLKEGKSPEVKEYQGAEKSFIAFFNEEQSKTNGSIFSKKADYLTDLRQTDKDFKDAYDEYQTSMLSTREARKSQAVGVNEVTPTQDEKEFVEDIGGALKRDTPEVTETSPQTPEFTDTATSDATTEKEVVEPKPPKTEDLNLDEAIQNLEKETQDLDNLDIETVAVDAPADANVDQQPTYTKEEVEAAKANDEFDKMANQLQSGEEIQSDTPPTAEERLTIDEINQMAEASPFDRIETGPDSANHPTTGDTTQRSSGIVNAEQVLDTVKGGPARVTSQINPEPLDLDLDVEKGINAQPSITKDQEGIEDLRTGLSVTEAADARSSVEGRGTEQEKKQTLETVKAIQARKVGSKSGFLDKLKSAFGMGKDNKAKEESAKEESVKGESVKGEPKGEQNKDQQEAPYKDDKQQEKPSVKLTNDQYSRLREDKSKENSRGTKSLGQAVKWGVGAALLMVAAIAFPPLAGVALVAMAGALVMTAWNAVDCAVAYNNANTITQKLNESNKAESPSKEPQKGKETQVEQEKEKTQSTNKGKDEVTKETTNPKVADSKAPDSKAPDSKVADSKVADTQTKGNIDPTDLAKVTNAGKDIAQDNATISDKSTASKGKATDVPEKEGPGQGRGS